MSIISDALKKARESRTSSESAVFSRERDRRPRQAKSGPRFSPAFLVFTGLAVVSGAVLYPFYARPVYDKLAPHLVWGSAPPPLPKDDPSTGAGHSAGRPGRSQFSVEEKPMFLGSENASFSLSGIAQFQDGYVAVVNGQILKKGDQIQGARVLAISSKSVELDYYGERIVLQKTF